MVTALREGGAERVVVVAPPEDSAEGPAVALAAREGGGIRGRAGERPAEMRDSIEIGLASRGDAVRRRTDVLLSPGDAPGITARIVAHAARGEPPRSRRRSSCRAAAGAGGIRWCCRGSSPRRFTSLPAGQGVNALLARHPVACGRSCRLATRESPTTSTARRTFAAGKRRSPDAVGASRWRDVRVKFFALAKERAGCSEIDLELDGSVSGLGPAGRDRPELAGARSAA